MSGSEFTVGFDAEFPPYEFYDAGEVVGIDVEIAGAIAETMGKTLEVEDMGKRCIQYFYICIICC